ncbi:hypothetical protein GCM10009839_46310 [Catenulispora yoronensis]|uniref:Uncharacterized protein n=1 Tax=Catenulispora yoronensis TaxID=450799 RepID=A0ABN2UKP0_9ACTN
MTSADEPGRPEDAAQAARPLLTYKNMPVPYTTGWSSEEVTLTGSPDMMLRHPPGGGAPYVAYRDEIPGAEIRPHGVLWGRMPDTPGVGEPRFLGQNINRQKAVMERAGCSVCGGDGEVWLVPAMVWEEYLAEDGPGAPYETSDPPVCRACIPLATGTCPNLRQHGFLFLEVRKWSISGVRGYVADPITLKFPEHDNDVPLHGAVGYDAARLRLTLAKGLLVTLRGITAHTDPDRVRGLGRRRGDEQRSASGRARADRIPGPRRGD